MPRRVVGERRLALREVDSAEQGRAGKKERKEKDRVFHAAGFPCSVDVGALEIAVPEEVAFGVERRGRQFPRIADDMAVEVGDVHLPAVAVSPPGFGVRFLHRDDRAVGVDLLLLFREGAAFAGGTDFADFQLAGPAPGLVGGDPEVHRIVGVPHYTVPGKRGAPQQLEGYIGGGERLLKERFAVQGIVPFRLVAAPVPGPKRIREEVLIRTRVLKREGLNLFQVVHAGRRAGRFARLAERGQQHRGENGDDSNHDKQFDQSK